MIELYVKGDSWLHRLEVKYKFLGLMIFVTIISLTANLIALLCLGGLTIVLYLSAGFGLQPAWKLLVNLALFLVIIFIIQIFTVNWVAGLRISLQLYFAVLMAGLLTISTKVSEMLDLFEWILRPLQRFGVDPWRVSLILTLTMRCIPLVSRSIHVSKDAWEARGLGRAGFRIVLPTMVRLIRKSEHIGDAISARGLEVSPDADRK